MQGRYRRALRKEGKEGRKGREIRKRDKDGKAKEFFIRNYSRFSLLGMVSEKYWMENMVSEY